MATSPSSYFPSQEDFPHASSNSSSTTQTPANKRKRGTGVCYLQSELLTSSSLSEAAKSILRGLLDERIVSVDLTATTTTPFAGGLLDINKPKIRKPIDTNMSDERILQLAQEGELSFLASLLRIIEEERGSVTTKFLIKACCLSVEPGKVPAYCDAKEMVMTAVHFLSQSFQGDREYYPTLPLLKPVSISADIEKRAYTKVGDWMLDDVLQQVLHLEQVFYEGCDNFKWLAREHCVPKLTNGRNLLLLKGSPPAFCMAKVARKTSTTAPRRKSTKAAAPVVAATLAPVSLSTDATSSTVNAADETFEPEAAVEKEVDLNALPADTAMETDERIDTATDDDDDNKGADDVKMETFLSQS